SVIAERLVVCEGCQIDGEQRGCIVGSHRTDGTGGVDRARCDGSHGHRGLMIRGDVGAATPVLILPAGLIRQKLPVLKTHWETLTTNRHRRVPPYTSACLSEWIRMRPGILGQSLYRIS